MFKGNRKYYVILVTIFIGVVFLQYMQPKPINWKRTYFKADKIPFGCYAIFNLLQSNYAKSVEVNKQTLYNLNEQNQGTQQTLVMVNETINLSKLDVKSLFAFLQKGNTVLLSANDFCKELKDTLQLKTESNFAFTSDNLDSLLKKSAFSIKYVQPKNNMLATYTYPTIAGESYFTKIDTTLFSVCAINKKEKPVLIEATIGKGKLLLSSTPDVFGNLFIVNHTNRFYTYTLLSKVKNNFFIWDEHYKTFNVQEKGLFQFIFDHNSLYMAYCILILGLLFFMVFEMKRKQRAIPIIRPLQNSTLEFVDVISHVYFNSKNHKHIAEESIHYFYFDVRRKYNVNTTQQGAEFYTTIHKLSGIAFDEIKQLFLYCENIKQAPSLTQYDLLELNDRINNFKQKSIR